MPIDLTTIPTPVIDPAVRSSLQLVRRMILLRWSKGKYLNAIAGNYGFKRPVIGFSDDEFFRAVTQVIIADYKAIGNAFWQLLEITLGPYIDPNAALSYMEFELAVDAPIGQGYIVLTPDDAQRIPLYGNGKIEATLGNEEEVEFSAVDRLLNRVRVKNPLTKNHLEGTKLRVEGACWEFIEARARRIAIRLLCLDQVVQGVREVSYLQPSPWLITSMREDYDTGDTEIKVDDSVLSFSTLGAITLLLDYEQKKHKTLEIVASAYNPVTRTFTVPALPSGFYKKGTEVRLIGVHSGSITAGGGGVIGANTLKAAIRTEDVTGLWLVDPGGGNREYVFVTGTNYQKRNTTAKITFPNDKIRIDYPFNNIPQGTASFKVRVSDTTGTIGTFDVIAVQWYENVGTNKRKLDPILFLSAPYGVDIPAGAVVEVVEDSNGLVTLNLSKNLTKNHFAGETILRSVATDLDIPSYVDHLPRSYWPQTDGTTKHQWPSGYLYDPRDYQISKIKKTPTSTIENFAKIQPALQGFSYEGRVYLFRSVVSEDFDPATALASPLGTFMVSGQTVETKVMWVGDNSLFPTTVAIDGGFPFTGWKDHPDNKYPGFGLRIIVGSEGGFSRTPVFYWGKSTTNKHEIYISGAANKHRPGNQVVTFVEELAVDAAVSGILGNVDGFLLEKMRIILDHTSSVKETIIYDSLELKTPTTAILKFDRGWTPQYGHDTQRVSNLDGTTSLPISIVPGIEISESRKDLYGFPLRMGGFMILKRLRSIVELVRAAGVKIDFYDDKDRILDL